MISSNISHFYMGFILPSSSLRLKCYANVFHINVWSIVLYLIVSNCLGSLLHLFHECGDNVVFLDLNYIFVIMKFYFLMLFY